MTVKQTRPCFRAYVQARHKQGTCQSWDRLSFNERGYNKILAEYQAMFSEDLPIGD